MLSHRRGFRALIVFACAIACAATAGVGPTQAEGITAAGPRRLIVNDGTATQGPYELPSTPFSATPVPLRTNRFLVPFTTTDVSDGGIRSGVARYRIMTDSFTPQGATRYLISGLEGCCTGWAENGGTRFASFTQLVIPLLTFNGSDQREVMGFPILPSGDDGPDKGTQWLTDHKEGNQGGAVVVPLRNGTSFVMWTDLASEPGESASSVRGVIVSATGEPTGDPIEVETKDTSAQTALDGAQLSNGRMILIYSEGGTSDVGGRRLFYGQRMGPAGNRVGRRVLLGATNDTQYGGRMRVAALPNGNFVVTWVDDRVGTPVPLFQVFSSELEPVSARAPFATFTTPGTGPDVAALADSRFVITGTISDESGSELQARLFSPEGAPIGPPLTLHSMNNPGAVAEQHLANAGYLLSTPPPAGGLQAASDPNRVFVTWRIKRRAHLYDLYGRLLTAAP